MAEKDSKKDGAGGDDVEKAKASKAAKEAKAEKAEKAKAANKKKDTGAAIRIAAEGETKVSPATKPRLEKIYHATVAPALMKQLGLKSKMQVPRIQKIVINCAVKDAIGNPKVLDNAMNDLMLITGQKPIIAKAKKAIATFKVRKGNAVAVHLTLRRARMFEFYDRLVNIALPRVRDFKGVSPKSFDGRGNYSLGLKEQIIFPEINYDQVDKIRGMTVTIVTNAPNNEQARALLTEMGMPFRK